MNPFPRDLNPLLHAWGLKLAATPKASNGLAGTLYLAPTGFLMLSVPNALVRAAFSCLDAPGVELPPAPKGGKFAAHITVMRPEEIRQIGGADKITERGKSFAYGLGRIVEFVPRGWSDISRVWAFRVHSPELQRLRRTYGLSSLPNNGKFDFHVTLAVRRSGVLSAGDSVVKGAG